MTVIEEIAAERKRQIEKEGWNLKHDDIEHPHGELARAAANYAAHAAVAQRLWADISIATYRMAEPPPSIGWPWDRKWWKPKDPRRDLIRAGALIVAEIERLDRAERADAA